MQSTLKTKHSNSCHFQAMQKKKKNGTAKWNNWWLVTLNFDQCIKFVSQKWIGFPMFSTTTTQLLPGCFAMNSKILLLFLQLLVHHMFHIMDIIWFDSISHLLLRHGKWLGIGYSMDLLGFFFLFKIWSLCTLFMLFHLMSFVCQHFIYAQFRPMHFRTLNNEHWTLNIEHTTYK